MWPESDGCPTHGVSCPVVPSPTPPGAGADLPGDIEQALYGCVAAGREVAAAYEWGRVDRTSAPKALSEAPTVIVTELRRLAAEVERFQKKWVDAEMVHLADETDLRFLKRERQAVFFALHPECPAHPGVPNTCDESMCDCFAADNLAQQVTTLRATQQAAAEQMREEAVAVIGAIYGPWNVEWSPADNFNAWKRATLGSLRALPLPTPDLDAIREAARAEAFAEANEEFRAARAQNEAVAERRGYEKGKAESERTE